MVALVLGAWLLGTHPASAAPGDAAPAAPPGASRVVVYRPPLDGAVRVQRPFDPPPQPWLAGHRGVDLAATAGASVLAPAEGVVTFAGSVAGRGVVTVTHDDGRRSSLEPVTATVGVGTRVHAGDAVGRVDGIAHGSAAPGSALHWGVREGDDYVDPWGLLPGRGPVVLLPVR